MAKVNVKTGGENYTQEVSARSHRWLADEPEDLGGADKGPEPFEQLLGALGSCTVTTLQMYAQRKGWPLEGVEAHLEYQRIEAAECGDCESDEGKVSVIELELQISGDLNDKQRSRLLEIAGRCPVNRALRGEIIIKKSAG
ncbi:MAG: OsmC family protein [bacterium]